MIKKFIKDEPKVTIVLIVALILAFSWVFTNRMPELFVFGSELMTLMFSIAVSVIAAVIFYIFQFYIQAVKVRSIAKKELSTVCSRIYSVAVDMFISSSTKDELEKFKINDINDFLSEGVASQISEHFDMEKEANHSPKMPWANRLALMGAETKERCDMIACKYSTHLTESFLASLHKLQTHGMVEFFRILDNRELLAFQKEHHKRTYLPMNMLRDLFWEITNINKLHELGLTFSPKTIEAQKGLIEKARIKKD